MSYDWHKTVRAPEGSPQFFEEIDDRFFGASPFFRGKRPFEGLIPFSNLGGKRVLEIGCGLGAHTQLLVDAGAMVTAIDLTPKAVVLTQKRLSFRGMRADVRLMDAERMEFGNAEFDFVWSWGVIHHSANPYRILLEAYRVLRSSGEFRLMVYHRDSIWAWTNLARGMASGRFFQGMSVADILSSYSDGHHARFYTRRELVDSLQRSGFSVVSVRTLGQTSELVPIPGRGLSGRFKSTILRRLPNTIAEAALTKFGGFLFAITVRAS